MSGSIQDLRRPELLAQREASSREIEVLALSLGSLVLLSVAVRMYVRIRMLRQFGPEDWSMIAAFAFSISQCGIAITVVRYGIMAARGNARVGRINTTLSQVSTGMFALALVALKISLGFFFLKIFSHKKTHRYFIIFIVIVSTIAGVAYFAFATFTCSQLKEAPGTRAQCPIQGAANVVFYIFSIVSIAGDFILTIMAVLALIQAKLPNTTKYPACGLLVLGAVGGVASTIRFALLAKPAVSQAFILQLYDVGKWTVVEHCVGIIAANLAMTRPLLHAFVSKIRGTSVMRSMTGGGAPSASKGSNLRYANQRSANEQHTDQVQHENTGEAYLLHDIKREVTVVVDEEKASADSIYTRGYPNHQVRYPSNARPR